MESIGWKNNQKRISGVNYLISNKLWMCLETGFTTNPGSLTLYQRKRGIDTSKRVKVS